ncbi:hypothetical protein [Caminibacter pacificus]|jgi:TolA-binding protein
MKKLLFLLSVVLLFGYDAKVEPYEVYKIKAPQSGEVLVSNKNLESKFVTNKLIVKIDDTKDKINLQNLKNQIAFLKEEIKNQEQIVKRKKSIYERYKNLKTKSQEQKDLKFYDYMGALNQLLNMKSQLSNLQAQEKTTLDNINKKNIKVTGYVNKIYVTAGDYVNPGVLVAEVDDTTKQKLTIYVPIDKIDSILNKDVYINGKLSDFKIEKVWSLPDSKYITSYRVDLVGKGLRFGDIVKVEFK